MEAALTTIIIGLAVVALLSVMGAATATNGTNRELTRAIFLGQELREAMASLPATDAQVEHFGAETGETLADYDDQDDFANRDFQPPINAQRQALAGGPWAGWRQHVDVANVDPNYLAGRQTLTGGSTDLYRVTVTVYRANKEMHRISWLAAQALE